MLYIMLKLLKNEIEFDFSSRIEKCYLALSVIFRICIIRASNASLLSINIA